jgi:hypothetical protein
MVARLPAVFLSYAHDSEQHRLEVRRFAEFLRTQGVEVVFDEWSAGERKDWSSWAIKAIAEVDFVVVVVSPGYQRAGDGLGPSDVSRGVQAEAAVLRDRLHGDRKTWQSKVLPVLLPGHDVDEIPVFLQPYAGSHYRVTALTEIGAEILLRTIFDGRPRSKRTTDEPQRAVQGWQRRAYVNHDLLFGADELVAAVAGDLSTPAVDRVVSVVGDGGIGKTAIAYEAVGLVAERRAFSKIAWSSAANPHAVDEADVVSRGGQEYWADILKDIADQLGFDLGLSRALWAQEFGMRVRELDSSERLLIVVDNLETLPDATGAIRQLRGMGIVAPHALLVTTRWELRSYLSRLSEFRVRPLGTADSARLIRHLGANDPELAAAADRALQPMLQVTEGNPFLIKLTVQQYLSSHRPLDHVLRSLRQVSDKNTPNLAHRVRSYLYTTSLAELERRYGEENADALLASFCVKGRGDAFTYDELAGVSGIDDADDFAAVLTAACQLSIVTSFGDPTKTTLDRNYTVHSLLYDFTCGTR